METKVSKIDVRSDRKRKRSARRMQLLLAILLRVGEAVSDLGLRSCL